METKVALKSKTLWVNFIMAGLALFVPGIHEMLQASPEIMVGIFTVVNIALRFITKDKITLS